MMYRLLFNIQTILIDKINRLPSLKINLKNIEKIIFSFARGDLINKFFHL